MSILLENEHGWLLCAYSYFNEIYRTDFGNDSKPNYSFKLRSDFFQIHTPLLMDSQAKKKDEKKLPIKMKKKAQRIYEEANKHTSYSETLNKIKTATKSLVFPLQDNEVTLLEWFENNGCARNAAKEVENLDIGINSILFYENMKDFSIIKNFGEERYLLPPKSEFLLSDITNINFLLGRKFDLIVMDPPWVNKSLKRKKRYNTLHCKSLLEIPLERLVNPGCLVLVWATNNINQIKFVKEKLFPKWGIIYCTKWYWSKITKKGEFIYPLDSHHKKPFENIIIGRVANDTKKLNEIESEKVIVSIPSSIHSHKPPLNEIMKSFLPEKPKCLELFARYLLPGWTSIGNEVIKLQNIKLFEKCDGI